METKKCTQCYVSKLRRDFYNRKASPDGLASNCKLCSHSLLKEWRLKQGDKYRATQRERYQRNSDKYKKRKAQYENENWIKLKVLKMVHRRQPKSRLGIKYPLDIRLQIANILIEKYQRSPVCPFTGEPLVRNNSSLDHIIPVSRGGATSDIDNLQLVSTVYNTAKGNLTDSEFARHWKLTWIP